MLYNMDETVHKESIQKEKSTILEFTLTIGKSVFLSGGGCA